MDEFVWFFSVATSTGNVDKSHRVNNRGYVRRQGRRIRAASMRKYLRRMNVRWKDGGDMIFGYTIRIIASRHHLISSHSRLYVGSGFIAIECLFKAKVLSLYMDGI